MLPFHAISIQNYKFFFQISIRVP